jgi:HAT1-interacting factor 1
LSLFKYSEASEHLSYALEDSTKKNGELSFENVDCLILLGKALLGNAIQQSAVLGNNKVVQATTTTQAVEGGEVAASSSAAFHFSGDDEEEDGGDEEGQEEEQDGDGDGKKKRTISNRLSKFWISLVVRLNWL